MENFERHLAESIYNRTMSLRVLRKGVIEFAMFVTHQSGTDLLSRLSLYSNRESKIR